MDDFLDDYEFMFSDESEPENDDDDDSNNNNNSGTIIPEPPISQTFSSADEAFDSLQAFGLVNGFAVIRRRSRKDPKTGALRYIDIVCDRGRTAENQSRGIRVCRSRRIDCPFTARLKLNTLFNRWSLAIEEATHNHGPISISALPAHRNTELCRRYNQIAGMLNEGLPIRYIISILRRESPAMLIRPRDLYNMRYRVDIERLNGRTPIQALISSIPREGNWYIKYQIHENRHVSAVFLSHWSSIQNLRKNSYILMIDSTYRTNRYNMPLFNIIGLTPQGGTFYIAFGFICGERESSFSYILKCLADLYTFLELQSPAAVVTDKDEALIKAVRNIWPSSAALLCVWHINKNILSHAKLAIRDYLLTQSTPIASRIDEKALLKQINDQWKSMLTEWYVVISARSISQKDHEWARFKWTYQQPAFRKLLLYIESEWLQPQTERAFLRCYTNTYLHFGQIATSRSEGSHWQIKRDLQSSLGDLLNVVKSTERTIINHHLQIEQALADEYVQIPSDLRAELLFSEVISHISIYALNKVLSIQNRYLPIGPGKPPIEHCTGITTRTLGIPCIHTILHYRVTKTPLPISEFHSQWLISRHDLIEPLDLRDLDPDPPIEWPHLLEPLVVQGRGRPRGSRNQEISRFEQTEQALQQAGRQTGGP